MKIIFKKYQSVAKRELEQEETREFYISGKYKEIYKKILELTVSLMNEANDKMWDKIHKEEKQREEFDEKYAKEKLEKVKKVTKKKEKKSIEVSLFYKK